MKPHSTRRWRIRLAVPAAALLCAVLALLAGQASASAAEPTGASAGLTVSLTSVSHEAAQARPAAARPGITARCGPGLNEYNRTNLCWVQTLDFTFLENETPVGNTVVTLVQYIALRPQTKSWKEYDTVTTVTPTGTTAPIEAVLTATCGAHCVVTGDMKGTLKPGLTGTLSYTATLAKDAQFNNASEYTLVYDAPPYIPTDTGHWGSPLKYRCDNNLAIEGTTGCVFAEYTPVLVLSLKKDGASAAMVLWAQVRMTAHWGWDGHGKPLTRLQNETVANDNREKICYDGSFHPIAGIGAPAPGTVKPWKDVDSCDEFPFAKTYQSGAGALGAHGTGADCAQLEAVRTSSSKTADEAAQWGGVKALQARTSAPCVRGHIPNRLNGAVGSDYSGLISSARLANKDPFWIAVVS